MNRIHRARLDTGRFPPGSRADSGDGGGCTAFVIAPGAHGIGIVLDRPDRDAQGAIGRKIARRPLDRRIAPRGPCAETILDACAVFGRKLDSAFHPAGPERSPGPNTIIFMSYPGPGRSRIATTRFLPSPKARLSLQLCSDFSGTQAPLAEEAVAGGKSRRASKTRPTLPKKPRNIGQPPFEEFPELRPEKMIGESRNSENRSFDLASGPSYLA